ncbi:MAG: hypothetical protein M0Z85_05335 [Gammaproteobacteria bacterium]|nr:hypothetical protein [Gammaproteobacteria bacterium]
MLVPAWMMNKKYAVLADWAVAFGTLLASAVALWVGTVGYKREEWERRRNDSILGAAIAQMLLEEVRDGVIHMKELKTILERDGSVPHREISLTLPHAGWSGVSTIPDRVLLRVIATAAYEITNPRHFHPRDVRMRVKDYYAHIVSAVARGQTRTEMLGLIEPEPGMGYIAIAEATAHVLEKTKGLLEENAKRWFPK